MRTHTHPRASSHTCWTWRSGVGRVRGRCGVELGSDLRALCQAAGKSDEGLASDSLHHHNHPYHLHHHHHHHALNQSNPSLTAACRLRASRVWHPPARRSRNASSTSLAPAVTRVAGATNARAKKKKIHTKTRNNGERLHLEGCVVSGLRQTPPRSAVCAKPRLSHCNGLVTETREKDGKT